PATQRRTCAPSATSRRSHSSATHPKLRQVRSERIPTRRPSRAPTLGPGSESVSGAGAVGSRIVMRAIPIVCCAMKAEVVATGVPFGEGPVWCPDGTLVVTSVAEGALYRVWPEESRAERIADTGGGANGAALAADGGFVVTQNGGFDFAATGLFTDPPPYRPAIPGLQRVLPDGSVTYLTDEPLQAPNDLVVRDNAVIVFTDPGLYPPPEPTVARVLSWSPSAGVQVVADGLWYVNGIAVEPDGNVVVIERMGLLRLDPSGAGDHEWVIDDLGRGGG